jgi:hypothetical protein
MMRHIVWTGALLLLCAAGVRAQQAAPPQLAPNPGSKEAAQAVNAAGPGDSTFGAADSGDAQPPVGDDPHAHTEGAPPLERRPMSSGEPSSKVPAGSIHVRVLDAKERPVPDAQLQLGTMTAASGRSSVAARTGPDGTYVFDKLSTGDKQAYRVNVLHDGAKYSSMPFRLPVDSGYDVVLRQLDTTRDNHDVVLYVGATSLELKDERLKVVQQARLVNIGSKTYLFPESGQLLPLPKDLLAFQAEEIMTDQHVREDKGQGVRISGSLPPGEVTLTWGFDVPQSGTTAEFTFDLPWVTFAYRVLADAAQGMTLEVDGMPPAELHADNGRRFLVTEVVKRVGEAPLRRVKIKLSGIPGPGPTRFIAVGLALLVIGLGVFLTRAPKENSTSAQPLTILTAEKDRLLARAKELDGERARGEIGPEFHEGALRELEEQLAGVLYEQKRLSGRKLARAAG